MSKSVSGYFKNKKNPTAIKLGVGVRPFNGTAIKKRMASLIY